MEILNLNHIEQLLRSGEISYFNFYNSDISLQTYYASRYYNNNGHDTIDIDQQIPTLFFDIECFLNGELFGEIKSAKNIINCISISHSNHNIIKSFYLLLETNMKEFGISENIEYDQFIKDKQEYCLNELITNKYIDKDDNYNIEIELFNNELELIRRFWEVVHHYDPPSISGYNSDLFDLPYLYFRTCELLGSKVAADRMISKFGVVKVKESFVNIPDFVNIDILRLYKPRSESGLNLGELLPQYTLDYVSEMVLGLKKLEYKHKNLTLDQFYITDPINFLLYNQIDTILTKKLNQKLRHIELYNSIRRIMKTPMNSSLIGSSQLFDTYVYSKLSESNKYIRFGINSELSKTINPEQLEKFPIPKGSKWKIKPIKIPSKIFQNITTKYPGAYVKTPIPTIINNDSLILDLDASLPPWEKILIKRNKELIYDTIENYEYTISDEILTWSDNKICWRKVLAKLEHNWCGELITFITETGKQITVTPNHSIYGTKRIYKSNINNVIMRADNLEINDSIIGLGSFNIKEDLQFCDSKILQFLLSKQTDIVSLERIDSISKEYYTGQVYDLSVEENERFFAGDGLGCHNSSLYPSMILQSNISFDSYRARILPPTTYKTLSLLENITNKKTQYPSELPNTLFDLIVNYVDENDSTKKGQTISATYYILMYLFDSIFQSNLHIQQIYRPSNSFESILLKTYLLPLIDIINEIHPQNPGYNQFIYDYLFGFDNLKNKYSEIYIINNVSDSNLLIEKYSLDEALSFMNNYSITLAGTLFEKHEKHSGLFTEFLKVVGSMRKQNKNLRDKNIKNSSEYNLYDSRQASYKVIMNTTYGLYGQSSFRYSDHWLAQSITNQGMLTLKLAAYLTEQHLNFRYGETNNDT